MNRSIIIALLLLSSVAKADPTWRVYISTNPPQYNNEVETVLSSTSEVAIPLVNDPGVSCKAWKPWFFTVPGIPYPLVQHRYFECDFNNGFAVATELGCGLRSDDVKYANLAVQTPNGLYVMTFNCANFVEDKQ